MLCGPEVRPVPHGPNAFRSFSSLQPQSASVTKGQSEGGHSTSEWRITVWTPGRWLRLVGCGNWQGKGTQC